MKRSRKTAAVLAMGALGLSFAVSASVSSGATRAGADRAPSALLQVKAAAALNNFLKTQHPTMLKAPDTLATSTSASSETYSYNWSGYADVASDSGTFSAVSGNWSVPRVSCTREDSLEAQWVGIDGWNDGTVEQDGTLDWCFEGQAYYYTWWEMYPGNDIITVGTTVRPGDQVSASVSESSGNYTLTVNDYSRPANSFSTAQSCSNYGYSCADTSSEWIIERPAFSVGLAPLATYGYTGFSNASETANGVTGSISSYPNAYQIQMVDATDSYQLNQTSPLTSYGRNAGTSFSSVWQNSW